MCNKQFFPNIYTIANSSNCSSNHGNSWTDIFDNETDQNVSKNDDDNRETHWVGSVEYSSEFSSDTRKCHRPFRTEEPVTWFHIVK
jgi:hypothetical protein